MTVASPAPQPLRLGFVGDVALNDSLLDALPGDDPTVIFAGVRDLLDGCDLVVGNLECACRAPEEPPAARDGILTAPESAIGCFDGTPLRVLSLANNHIMDAGIEGLERTRRALGRLGIASFGAGSDEEDASQPLIHECRGWRIGFLGASGFSYANARAGRAGAAPLKRRRMLRAVRALLPRCDLIVAVVHADIEFVDFPAPWRVDLSRALIDAGAHLVIHHHPHVLQGAERYRDGYIAYSTGNWVFRPVEYQNQTPQSRYSALLEVSVSPSGDGGPPVLEPVCHPVKLNEEGLPAALPDGPEAKGVLARHSGLTEEYRDPGRVSNAWRRTSREEARRTFFELYYTAAKEGPGDMLRWTCHILKQQQTWQWLRGLLFLGKY